MVGYIYSERRITVNITKDILYIGVNNRNIDTVYSDFGEVNGK